MRFERKPFVRAFTIRSLHAVLAFVSFGLLAACGGSRSAEPAAEDLAQAVCDFAETCCDPGEIAYFLGPHLTSDDCAERLVAATAIDPGGPDGHLLIPGLGRPFTFPNVAALSRAIRDGRVSINREALRACVELVRGQSCDGPLEPPPEVDHCVSIEEEEDPCDPRLLIEGRVGRGGRCESPFGGLECKDDLVCVTIDAIGSIGACAEPQRENEPCFDDDDCLPDLYCSQLDGTCQIPGEVGAACAYSDPTMPREELLLIECEEDLTCSPFDSRCVARCARGHACDADDQCGPGLECIASFPGIGFLFCDTPRAAGQPCFELDDCAAGLTCQGSPGTCGPLYEIGAQCRGDFDCLSGRCDSTFWSCATAPCPNGRTCEGAICLPVCSPAAPPPLPDGSYCQIATQCESDFCNLAAMPAVCATRPLPNNTPCFLGTDCASLVCFAGTCLTGAGAGAGCDPLSTIVVPCDPFDNFCDTDAEPPVCAPFVETGEACDRRLECRSHGCEIIWGRMMCSPMAPPNEHVCGGSSAI